MFKISSLELNRTLPIDDSVKELADHISRVSLRRPILVRGDHLLIDGARRVAAANLLGHLHVPAVVTSIYREAIDHLRQTMEYTDHQSPLTPRRMAELKRDMGYITYLERGVAHRAARAGEGRPQLSTHNRRAVEQLADLFGVKSSYLATISRLFELERKTDLNMDPVVLRNLLNQLDRGEIRPGSVVRVVAQSTFLRPDSEIPAAVQRESLRQATAAMSGVFRGLRDLGSLNSRISKDELRQVMGQLMDHRKSINHMIRILQEEIDKR